MTESEDLPFNFGGIAEPAYSEFERARILVWPVPYEGTVSYGHGAADGPRAIIEASRNMELYDEEIGASVYRLGIHTLDELRAIDPPQAMMDQIERMPTCTTGQTSTARAMIEACECGVPS